MLRALLRLALSLLKLLLLVRLLRLLVGRRCVLVLVITG